MPLRSSLEEKARATGNDVVEAAQRIYFEAPGLDTITVRELTKIGRSILWAGRVFLLTRIALGRDRDGTVRRKLSLLPRTGYDSLMFFGLAFGTALGYFRGGAIHSLIWWDSADPNRDQARKLPSGHPHPGVRRFDPPTNLGDLAADIDDLYWAEAYGQAVKVTRVGEGETRRWLVSLPGTDHSGFESEPNTADLESNLREELNMPSAMRLGTIATIRSAMSADGLTAEEMVNERVLICGHSQGGMVAVGLAATDPHRVGFTVDAVITLGSPTRRLRLRPDVNMVAFEHDQDIIPSMDATPRRELDQRVVIHRSLNRPRKAPLFYAHSSSTYTETVRKAELRHSVAPWGRSSQVMDKLLEYLPKPGEPTRVTHHYAWQDLVEAHRSSAVDQYLDLQLPEEWAPVEYGGEVVLPEVEVVPSIIELSSGLLAPKSDEDVVGEDKDSKNPVDQEEPTTQEAADGQ